MTACKGCGAPLPPPNKGRGRKRLWCSDKCRKQTTYVRHCVDCGGRISASDGNRPNAPKRCLTCAPVVSRIWTEEAVITAIRAWADEHGGIPPCVADWSPGRAIDRGHPEKAEKFYADDAWPHVNSVQTRFGSWNAAITAAGFSPRRPSNYGRDGEDMELCAEIRERYEAGESGRALAREHDCTPTAICYRIRKAGGTIRTLSEAQKLRRAA